MAHARSPLFTASFALERVRRRSGVVVYVITYEMCKTYPVMCAVPDDGYM